MAEDSSEQHREDEEEKEAEQEDEGKTEPPKGDDPQEQNDDESENEKEDEKMDGDEDPGEENIEDEEENEDEEEDLEEEEDLSEAPPSRPKDPRSRKRRRRDKMFQDCLTVQIPIDCTADLGLAMRRTRRKRIESIVKAFPELAQETKSSAADASDDPMDSVKGDTTMEAEDEEDGEKRKKASKDSDTPSSRKKPAHIPRREDYANVVDYLEAKYAQGVMLNDDEEDEDGAVSRNDDDDEGQGSVYSQSSFLDDRDLQRGVAEQVLANSTTTKLELENNFDDAFFVNVGNLEVEESFLTEQGYDPVDDVENVKKAKKRKRKPAEAKDKTETPETKPNVEKGETKKKKATNGETPTGSATAAKSPGKKKAEKTETDASKKKPKAAPKAPPKKKKGLTEAEKIANSKKKEVDAAYKVVLELLKNMSHDDLPRRKTKERVAITCPPDKKPGDSILFANPHLPVQRLKVKIPKNTKPGATFRVTVPVAPNPEDDDDTTDHNKWSREFYDAFGEYCNLYDDWIDLVAVVKKEAGVKDFVVYFEKRKKFEDIHKDAPPDLKTPLDRTYMQKLLRRARQNRHKRERTLKRQEERARELRTDHSSDQDDNDDGKSAAESTAKDESSVKKDGTKKEAQTNDEEEQEEEEKQEEEKQEELTHQKVFVPQLSTEFPEKLYSLSLF